MNLKLTDLDPRWIGFGNGSGIKTGISFLCPHCRATRLAAHFANPIDPQGWLAQGVTRHRYQYEWERDGDTFEALTLRPSIDAYSPAIASEGHWHGFITNGEVSK